MLVLLAVPVCSVGLLKEAQTTITGLLDTEETNVTILRQVLHLYNQIY